ncbi:hypothetical protein F5Y15DRAFT_122459 [Xylariaceae sp. FL0016]|nr:hypothetical protein F5Y15DRAFT_122459 [Xylariaceae sp. FL0016]
MAYTTVGDFIPQLTSLPSVLSRPVPASLGGQNFTHCCMLALNTSLAIHDGNLSYADRSFVAPGVSVPDLLSAVRADEFPCGASFSGDRAGAPEIRVPYAWCAATCPGWELSHSDVMPQWIGPLVQFIVPSLAFCTNVPRTRKLAIPDLVFRARPRTVVGFFTYWVMLLGVLVLMTVDTVVWLSICFAFAGPMLLSAVYEYALDRKVLEFLSIGCLDEEAGAPRLGMRLRAQLLLAVVVGNIRMAMLEKQEEGEEGYVDGNRHDSVVDDAEKVQVKCIPGHKFVHNSIFKRIATMIDEYEIARRDGAVEGAVSLPIKLKALLNSQASFGSTIGAPILFFVGGFVYTVLDSDSSLGDNDTAHALAFGMWWMVIPYVAIVACAMLASNSPSTLDGIVYDGGNVAVPDIYDIGFLASKIRKLKAIAPIGKVIRLLEGYSPMETAFEGRFRTVKLWKRGLNKRQWVQEAINEYEDCFNSTNGDRRYHDRDRITPQELRRHLTLKFQDCFRVAIGALFLVLAPCTLAFLTSYNTPRAGLSCRSLTYLVYAISQVGEMILWTFAARLRIKYGNRWHLINPIAKRICWYGQVFVGFFSVFCAVGGTMMQLLGVYRSCACSVPATYWGRLDDLDAYMILSDNSAASIVAAQNWWTVTGSTAVGVVGIVCALAWWHQRRLRKIFRDEADKLEGDELFGRGRS